MELELLIRNKDATQEDLVCCQNEGHEVMIELMGHMAKTESNIVNDHNQLFMNILDRIKQEDKHKAA